MLANIDSGLKPGDKVGIAFDHVILEHPVYGKATNVSGIFPLQLRYGEYQMPSIVSDPIRLGKIVKNIKSELDESCWENELDDVIEQKLKDYILIAAYTNPVQDIETPRMHAATLAVITSFIADDILDAIENCAEIGLTYKNGKLPTFLDDIISGKFEKFEDIPNMVPEVLSLLHVVWKFKTESEACIPDFHTRDQEARQERKNTLVSFILLMENSKDNTIKGKGFSEEILLNFYGNTSAMLSALEYFVEINDIDVSEKIRDDVLFMRFKQCVANISSLMNAIFGLPKDMRIDQVNDSPILRQVVNKGTKLQDAFDKTVKCLENTLQDMSVAARKLRQCYKNHPEVDKFIRCGENLVDGQFICYTAVARYGKTNLKIKKYTK